MLSVLLTPLCLAAAGLRRPTNSPQQGGLLSPCPEEQQDPARQRMGGTEGWELGCFPVAQQPAAVGGGAPCHRCAVCLIEVSAG